MGSEILCHVKCYLTVWVRDEIGFRNIPPFPYNMQDVCLVESYESLLHFGYHGRVGIFYFFFILFFCIRPYEAAHCLVPYLVLGYLTSLDPEIFPLPHNAI
jgi:hypothetical protein